jgi:hypothetical protein
MSQQQSNNAYSLVAMVALNTPSLPPPVVLFQGFKALSGVSIDLTSLQSKNGTIVFEIGNDNVAIALMPTPIPWSNLEGPCATAWWWPDATEKMKCHTSHVLVGLVGDKGDLIQRCISLTHLTAAVAEQVDAAGIYWGSGTLVHEPQVFIEQAKEISLNDLPLLLWIDFRLEQNDDGSYRLFTTGMKIFDQKEIEITHSRKSPREIFNFVHAIADYVITSKKSIQAGETIGRSEVEKVRVNYAPSMWDAKTTVMTLDF